MKRKPTYNPYAIKNEAGFSKLLRASVLICPLISLALYFFGYQLLVANGAPRFLSTTVYYISEVLSTGALFATLALLLLTVTHEEAEKRRKLLLWETASLFGISLVARVGIYLLTAFLDELRFLGGFYLNDVTLSYLVDKGAFNLLMLMLSVFLGVLSMLFVIFVSLALVKKVYSKTLRGKSDKKLLKLPVLVYLIVSLTFALLETVITVWDIGFALTASVLSTLLMPYFEIAILTFVGQYLMGEIVSHFES